ncbi:alpha/beta fold hydrolase [Nonomuraea sp. C10]|uniref:alpha/beta fold hydrolase n=1 Tax=Nonomuraea sp. C10 TaxID=2600577 RepID=UPI0011CDDD0F|nr:alpha/beta hydrolase [Nonomuraea sp. C10]TXK40722.1 alpha/beta hydrolase [Nonomuraea sp. C10]
MRERWDDVGGRRMRSLEVGRRGETVVLLPGLGAVGYMKDTLAGCASWAHAFLLDVPGFGHRPPRPCAAEVPAVAEAVGDWLEAVPDGPVVLAGHSSGAQVALRVAAAHPARVRSLVLLGPTFPPRQRTLRRMARPFLRTVVREPLSVLPVTLPYYLRGGPAEVLRCVRSAQSDFPEYLIGKISCPVLVVRGARDHMCPKAWADGLAITAPLGRSVTVPGAHVFPFQHGGMTASLIAEAAALADSYAPMRPSYRRAEPPAVVLPSSEEPRSASPGV